MTGFSEAQVRELRRKLDRRDVHTREADNRSVDYIEGWFAISEANAIFGFDGWDREMTHFERVFERNRTDATTCAYIARVRIRVRTKGAIILREGSGWGSATCKIAGDAHERALKAAETDATKRALATFGNRFGLGLYDKEQNGVTRPKPVAKPPSGYSVRDAKGAIIAEEMSPEAFCGAIRQMLDRAENPAEVEALWARNENEVSRMRKACPSLQTSRGQHFADVLAKLASDRIGPFHRTSGVKLGLPAPLRLKPSRIAPGGRIDKSQLAIGTELRLRDKDHLKFVAQRPCLICARMPTHAHHLTFAQRRGAAIKVSDEFTVPLCAMHHDECHRSGNERDWWNRWGCDPNPVAAALWAESHAIACVPPTSNGLGAASTPTEWDKEGEAGGNRVPVNASQRKDELPLSQQIPSSGKPVENVNGKLLATPAHHDEPNRD
jgi:DNA recombination protein Rad52